MISNVRAARVVEVDLLDTYESLVRSALADTALSARTGYPAKTAAAAASARRLLGDHQAGLRLPARPPCRQAARWAPRHARRLGREQAHGRPFVDRPGTVRPARFPGCAAGAGRAGSAGWSADALLGARPDRVRARRRRRGRHRPDRDPGGDHVPRRRRDRFRRPAVIPRSHRRRVDEGDADSARPAADDAHRCRARDRDRDPGRRQGDRGGGAREPRCDVSEGMEGRQYPGRLRRDRDAVAKGRCRCRLG